jgi:hypothetical protein
LVGQIFTAAQLYGIGQDSLLNALGYQGGRGLNGSAQQLIREGVAAMLNAANPGVHFPLTVSQIESAVDAALQSQRRDTIQGAAASLASDNSAGCPLSN